MASFTKGIDVNGKTVEFSFIGVYTVNGMRYYVSVVDKDLKPYLFHMENRGNRWIIIDAPKVPQWIHNVQAALEQAILSDPQNSLGGGISIRKTN